VIRKFVAAAPPTTRPWKAAKLLVLAVHRACRNLRGRTRENLFINQQFEKILRDGQKLIQELLDATEARREAEAEAAAKREAEVGGRNGSTGRRRNHRRGGD
jgi:hypothetical protein